ncbi:MAG TPA: CheR family methyltransferase, partial [Longimicrobium sp.]|uniref:CheR family methyltransferase n=1 Tax=Longimicrobium sp. TaxID=2029185 RepID=UPI002ED8C00D
PRDPEFESLVEFLKETRGFDFSGYKRSTLTRRVERRMATLEIASYDAYRDFLELHPEEYGELFNTILINVTSFFRDRDAWDTLAREYVPALLRDRGPDAPIRVWSAGCASGEETYSLVMLLVEAMGVESFRERVKVYATDRDDEALAHARAAVYQGKDLDDLPEGYAEKYFEPVGTGFVFRADLRRQVIFGKHDLVHDAPISHLDLLACRNVMMYFNTEVQASILARFHFALKADGLLFLGRAEMMRSHGGMFVPGNLGSRVFRKAVPGTGRDRLLLLGRGGGHGTSVRLPASPAVVAHEVALRDAALNAGPVAQLVVGAAGLLLLANDAARRLFGIAATDLGRPLHDLKVSYRPVELRSRIEQAVTNQRPVFVPNVEHATGDELRSFDVQVTPLDGGDGRLGVSITFVDVTRHTRLKAEVDLAGQALETAFEELQSTNEELETTNEELQSTVEELETTNEELQSTNEELETMNEELQSTNEELETTNDELHRRTASLNDVNAYLASVLTSLRAGVVVVDREMLVQVWNRSMEELWGLRADEVNGQPLLHLDIGLPVEQLKAPLRAVLEARADYQESELDAVNRRGRPVRCHIAMSPLRSSTGEIRGTVILLEDRPVAAAS